MSKPRTAMKRRLRKKLRLGEFQEFGFEVDMATPGGDADGAFLDAWVDFVESRGWLFGGGMGDGRLTGLAVKDGRGSLGEADRDAAVGWLAAHAPRGDGRVGPLIDAWHGQAGESGQLGRSLLAVTAHRPSCGCESC